MAGEIHFLLGPVGAGKSTYAAQLQAKSGGMVFDLDDWMARLYGDDERPAEGRIEWYLERRDRVLRMIWDTALAALSAGTSVVLELGLVRRADRDAFLPEVLASGHSTTFYVLDAPREVRRARVIERNEKKGATFSMVVPLEVFEMASDAWEPPEEEEFSGCPLVNVP